MRKHIFGLVIFSFIVGAAALIYAVFNYPEITQVRVSPDDAPEMSKSCWRMNRQTKFKVPRIQQAVLNMPTKNLSYELDAPQNSDIALHFFVKDKNGTRLIKSMFVTDFDKNQVKPTDSYQWLKNLDSHENLYVVAEKSSAAEFGKLKRPDFDANKAVPVLLDYGK